jgi:putative ABC transport system permease protein
MSLSFTGFLVGALLLAIPYYIMLAMGLRLVSKFTRALLLLMVRLAVVAALMGLLMKYDSPWLNIPFVLLMAVAAGWHTLRRARLKGLRLLVPLSTALAVAALVFGLYVIFLEIRVTGFPGATMLLPVVGLLLGHATLTVGKAVDTYYCGLAYHGRLYEYLRANGATHREAVDSFLRRAMTRALTSEISSMTAIVGGSAPVMMWMLLLTGKVDVVTAAGLQLLFMIAMCAASLSAVAAGLWMARRYSFDEYDRLREVK